MYQLCIVRQFHRGSPRRDFYFLSIFRQNGLAVHELWNGSPVAHEPHVIKLCAKSRIERWGRQPSNAVDWFPNAVLPFAPRLGGVTGIHESELIPVAPCPIWHGWGFLEKCLCSNTEKLYTAIFGREFSFLFHQFALFCRWAFSIFGRAKSIGFGSVTSNSDSSNGKDISFRLEQRTGSPNSVGSKNQSMSL